MPGLLVSLPVILIALFALASWLTAIEQQQAQAPEIDVSGWGDKLDAVTHFPWAVLKATVTAPIKLTNAILSRLAAAKLAALTSWFTAWYALVRSMDTALLHFTTTTADAIHYQTKVATPRAIDRKVRPVNKRAMQAGALAGLAVAGQTRWGRTTTRDIDHTERIGTAARKKARTAARTADQALAGGRAIDKTVGRLRARVKALEKPLTAGAAAAVLALGMRKIGFRFWKCGAFRRVGRQLGCGHFAVLESLLAVTFDVLTVVAICRFLPLADSIAARTERALRPVFFLTDSICEPAGMALPSATERGAPPRTSWLPSGI
jgi:hypothetical protein